MSLEALGGSFAKPVFASNNEIGVLSWPYHDHIWRGQVQEVGLDERTRKRKVTNLDG
jgi:hypothetical protein